MPGDLDFGELGEPVDLLPDGDAAEDVLAFGDIQLRGIRTARFPSELSSKASGSRISRIIGAPPRATRPACRYRSFMCCSVTQTRAQSLEPGEVRPETDPGQDPLRLEGLVDRAQGFGNSRTNSLK